MEVKPGYKQTDVGVIPEDWDVKPIRSLLEKNSRITYGVVQPGKDDPSGVQFVRGGDVFDGKIDVENLRRIPQDVSKSYTRTVLHGGEILISLVGFPGESAIVPEGLIGANIARQVALVRLGKAEDINPIFICHYLRSNYGKRLLLKEAFGSAQQVINLKDVNKLHLPCPIKGEEQHSIATALSDMDALLDGLDRLIAKKRAIKQATMQQLLTGQTRLPGFSGAWEIKRLGDLGATYGGLVGKNKADFGTGSAKYVPFINVIANVQIDGTAFDAVNVEATENQNKVAKGDLLFNGSSETPEEVALCSFMAKEVKNLYLNSFCFGLRVKNPEMIDGLFLAYYIRSPIGRDLMKSLAQGSTRYNLSKRALLEAQLPLPEKEEQTAIATALSDMDAEITALETRRTKTRALKQAMMQELLTGRTRLV